MNKNPYDRASQAFQVLAHPQRLHILDELRRDEACVCHLQTALDRPQAYVSQQLRVLREADAVAARQEGLNVYYRVIDADLLALIEVLLGPPRAPRSLPHCPCPRCAARRDADHEDRR